MTPTLPDVLRGLAMTDRILLALRMGPQRMPVLCRLTGEEDTRAGRLRLFKHLSALRGRGQVQLIGSRHTSVWRLATDTRRPAPVVSRPRMIRPAAPTPPAAPSWWVVPPTQFHQAAEQRARSMGWYPHV